VHDYLKRIEEIAREACENFQVALYDLELKSASKGLLVIIYVTKVTGISVGECQKVSKYIANILEEKDFVSESYFLEVSSPGVERALKQKKHYVNAINELVKITYNTGETNEAVVGILLEVLPDVINVDVDGEMVCIEFTSIKKARTYFDYKTELKEKEKEKERL